MESAFAERNRSMKYPDEGVDKTAIWQSYNNRAPLRVPCMWFSNTRIFLQDPALNTEGYTFQQAFEDPEAAVRIALHYQLYCRTVLNHYSDAPWVYRNNGPSVCKYLIFMKRLILALK
jgi:hypothetical protein